MLAREAMDAVIERKYAADGGLLCPKCETVCDVYDFSIPSRELYGMCPVHRRFTIDVTDMFDDEKLDRMLQ